MTTTMTTTTTTIPPIEGTTEPPQSFDLEGGTDKITFEVWLNGARVKWPVSACRGKQGWVVYRKGWSTERNTGVVEFINPENGRVYQ